MKNVSEEFKKLSKKIKLQDLKLSIIDGEKIVKEIHVMPVNIFNSMPVNLLRARKEVIAKELRYSFEGELFKTIMQQIEITVKNASEIKGKNINFQYGIQVNNQFEYVDMGEYHIKDVEDDKNKEELTVTGYDKMLNFMKTFKQSELLLEYPCRIGQLVNRMGEVCGVELYSTDFYNSDLIVEEDFFTAQELTYRDILEKIAQTTLTTIFIKKNKLYLCKIGENVQTLDTSFLSELVVGEKFGPINALVLGRGSVEDNIEDSDQQSIDTNGRCEIRFDENEFVDSKRNQVIVGMFQQIKGLEYFSFEASNVGLMWLEPCDMIVLKDREESEYSSIYLKAEVFINTGISGNMGADIPETTTTEYKVTSKEEKKTLKVERIAKKNEGLIKDIIEEVGDRAEKSTSITQDIDSISQKVSNIEDLTNTIEGNKTINLENCMEGDLLELHIYGNNNVFEYLYPSDTLYPSGTLYPKGDSRIIVTDEDRKQTTYELEVLDVLRQYGDVYDEYVLENGKAKVIRRIAKDGSVLANETTEDLGNFSIKLSEGTNTIEIQNYTAKIKAKFAIKSNYTDVFATKVEMNSSITQTAEEINLEVKKKVDENEVISKINQSAEAVGISADKINFKGKVLNLSNDKEDDPNFNVFLEGEESTRASVTPIMFWLRNNGRTAMWLKSSSNSKGGIGSIDIPNGGIITFYGVPGATEISNSEINTPLVTQTSLEESKKNFEKLNNGLDIIKNTDIYKYNLKSQKDTDKKHIGFVIGKDYKYSKEITALDNEGKEVGVDTYSMISVAYKAIQEQQEVIEQLQTKIKELEEKQNG